MNEIVALDRHLFVVLNNLGSQPFDQFWIMISEKWIWTPLYIIFLYLLFKNYPLRSLVFILVFVALGITVSDQLAGIFKNGIQRLRPCNDLSLHHLMRIVDCGGPFGFYSSHASNSFFLAMFLTQLLKKKFIYFPFLIFFWAALVSYSRIYLGVHFPMDIAFGALTGTLLGGLFAALMQKVLAKQKTDFA